MVFFLIVRNTSRIPILHITINACWLYNTQLKCTYCNDSQRVTKHKHKRVKLEEESKPQQFDLQFFSASSVYYLFNCTTIKFTYLSNKFPAIFQRTIWHTRLRRWGATDGQRPKKVWRISCYTSQLRRHSRDFKITIVDGRLCLVCSLAKFSCIRLSGIEHRRSEHHHMCPTYMGSMHRM